MNKQSKALVTGGAGFIGSHLSFALQKQEYAVTVMDDFLSSTPDNLKDFEGVLIRRNVSQPFDLDQAYDVVFHHGDITDPRYEGNRDIFQSNVAGFENILKHCLRMKAKLIYASTAGLYGNGPIPMHEDQPKEILSNYARSKLAMDELAAKYFGQLPIVGLRYFNVFGPREAAKGRAASMVYHLYQQMRQGKRPRLFKQGEQTRDFIYVKDVVSANLCAITGKPGVYNIGTGVATSFNKLVALFNWALNLSLEPEYFDMPYDPKTYQHHTQADTSHAKRYLGFQSVWPIKEAIKDYMDYLGREHEEAHRPLDRS